MATMETFVETIKQHPGVVQVTRAVKVDVPGKPNVETVFSGAGKFTEEAKSTGPTLLRRMVKLHYNWKYTFLRPSIEQVIRRYKEKWPGQTGKVAAMAAIVRWRKKQPPLAQKAEAVGVGAGPSAEADAADAEESE